MTVNFIQRPAKSVVYVATIRPSERPLAHHIEVGDDVKLYHDTIEVFIKIEQVLDGRRFSGRVLGANGHGAVAPAVLGTGAVVTFTEDQVFTCSKRR